MKQKNIKKNDGYAIVYLLVIMFIFSTMMLPIINLLITKTRVINSAISKEQALQIADAGVNYYQWHLAHYPTDYKDGTTGSGPYEHDYIDKDTQVTVGKFSLEITPPSTGSTIVTIKSTGWTNDNPNIKRTVTARYGIPSLAKYAFLSNNLVWIGNTESISGEMQSNNGIRFDGLGNAPISSAKATYTCPSTQGCSPSVTKNGVWGSASQAVQNLWQFPVPVIDFSSLTADLGTLQGLAQSGGIHLTGSNDDGYSLVFTSNGKVSVYIVNSLESPTSDYRTRTLLYTVDIPSNGVIFIEDKVWVEGVVKGRVMVVSAKIPYNPSTAPSIYISKNLTYAAKDGTNVLGLLAQKDVLVSYRAPSTLEIDGALIAQNGYVRLPNYGVIKDSITTYGSIMSYGQWTWSYTNSSGAVTSGYRNTYSNYDSNLLFGPPPSFPLSSSGYEQLDWTSN